MAKTVINRRTTMKKKLVILCIAAAMSVSMLGGCGNSAKTTDSTKTEDTTKDSDQAAADKFKEASEAYSVLSDPEKRRHLCTGKNRQNR